MKKISEEAVSGKFNRMQLDLENNATRGMPAKAYNKAQEDLKKHDPYYAGLFSDNEPSWMKPIKASHRDNLVRQLTTLPLEDEIAKVMAKPVTALLCGTGATIIDLCIYSIMQFIPKQYHYIPMLAIPLTNTPIFILLCRAWHNITTQHKAQEEQLEHYRSLSIEELLREAHVKNIGSARQLYTPDAAQK